MCADVCVLTCVCLRVRADLSVLLWTQAKPHLQTFRSSQAKEEALKNFDHDRVSRKGVFGQGVYEAAKN